jgi:hypothetical protein
MRAIKTFSLFIVLFLAACTTPSAGGGYTYLLTPAASPDVLSAQSTYQAAVAAATSQAAIPTQTAQAQYAAATEAAASATTQAGATSDAMAVQMTSQAIALQGTREAQAIISTATFEAISANATAQAMSSLATAEAILVADEANRLQLQRQAEAAAIERGRVWDNTWPWLVAAASVALIIVAGSLAYTFIKKSQPVIVNDGNHQPRLIIYGGGVQALPNPTRPQITAPVAPVAPPDEDLTPIPLPALGVGHVLIAGETGSGKSTAMKAVLGSRQNVIVLDPHDAPGEWGNNTTVIGGGRDFKAIGQFIVQTSHLLNERYQQRASGVRRFDPITVASDELPAIVDALGKDMWSVFRLWLREGRKVSLFVIFSTQSTRVKTLGIEGESDLLENFASAIVLGKVAAAEYPELVQGMAWPAVIRTAQGARAVIIPHEEVAPNAAALREYPNQQGKIEPPAQPFVAPVPQPIVTEKHGTISPMEIMNVLRMKRQGESGRTIEEAVFGTPGGAAYYKVKTILEAYGHMLQTA